MLTVSGLFIYPVKSLSGIAVDNAVVTSRGLQHDRRLMLVDEHNCFLTQRDYPQMALLQPVPAPGGLYFQHKKNAVNPLFVPREPATGTVVMVTVWDDVCAGIIYQQSINEWFSNALGIRCSLVYMPDSSRRAVDKKYAQRDEITSFSDAYPILIISQCSLDDLNARLTIPIPMNRFRPNIVFTGGEPFLEDKLSEFSINNIVFKGVKPCARCTIPTINQDDSSTSKEPLKTLATYRFRDNKILFGQNLLHEGDGIIRIGDTIDVRTYQVAAI
jgi:uncharacterized protein YcbX